MKASILSYTCYIINYSSLCQYINICLYANKTCRETATGIKWDHIIESVQFTWSKYPQESAEEVQQENAWEGWCSFYLFKISTAIKNVDYLRSNAKSEKLMALLFFISVYINERFFFLLRIMCSFRQLSCLTTAIAFTPPIRKKLIIVV